MKHIVIAVDGPAGAGKSTIAKSIAQRMSVIYVDTGAMYRTVALYAIRNNIDFNDRKLISACLNDIDIEIKYIGGGQRIYLGGEDVSDKIRSEEVSMGASAVAVIPEVRLRLTDIQRKLGESDSVIMDGRDIGTHVFPDADIKIFLTASAEERALRRYEQLKQNGIEADFTEVLNDIKARDKNDSERSFAPLVQAADAVRVDTTGLLLDEAIGIVESIINRSLQ